VNARRTLLAATLVASILGAPGVAGAAPGDVDPAFGDDGHVTGPTSAPTAVGPDDALYSIEPGGVLRRTADGDVDSGYGGGDGLAELPDGVSPGTITVDAAGRVVVAATRGGVLTVVRLLPTGAVDVVTPLSGGYGRAIEPSGDGVVVLGDRLLFRLDGAGALR